MRPMRETIDLNRARLVSEIGRLCTMARFYVGNIDLAMDKGTPAGELDAYAQSIGLSNVAATLQAMLRRLNGES